MAPPLEGGGEESSGGTGTVDVYVWFNNIEAVSEVTRLNWDEIFDMKAQDYLAYLAYVKEKARREEIRIRQEAAKYRH